MSGLFTRVETALGEHDAAMARCPVSNPKRGQVFGADDPCPICRAKASGSCGISSNAGYRLAIAIRTAITIAKAEGRS